MKTLPELLAPMTISELLDWALSLDPNSSWDESVEFDSSITADDLRQAMLDAYDDDDTHEWINRYTDDDGRSYGPWHKGA